MVVTGAQERKSSPAGVRTSLTGSSSRFVALALSGFVGIAAGVVAKLSDLVPGGWVGDLATFGGVWVAVLALLARLMPRPARAAGAAAVFFAAMLVAYYGMTIVVLHYPITPRLVLAWGIAAVTVCPAIAALLAVSYRSSRVLAGVPIGLVGALVFVDGTVQRAVLVLSQPDLAVGSHPVQAGFDVLAALVISVVLPRRPRVRILAILTTAVAAVVLVPLLDQTPRLSVFG